MAAKEEWKQVASKLKEAKAKAKAAAHAKPKEKKKKTKQTEAQKAAKEKAAAVRAVKAAKVAEVAVKRKSLLAMKEENDVAEIERWVNDQDFPGVSARLAPSGNGYVARVKVFLGVTATHADVATMRAKLPSSYVVYEGPCVACGTTTQWKTACKRAGCKTGDRVSEFFQCVACYRKDDARTECHQHGRD